MSDDPTLVRALLACYPSRWRRRYGDEYAALLHDHLDLRIPALGVDRRRSPRSDRCPPAPEGVVHVSYPDNHRDLGDRRVHRRRHRLPEADRRPGVRDRGDRHPAVGWSFNLLVIASLIALAAIVIAALPTAAAMVRGRANGAWPYVAVPFVAFAAWYGVLRLAFLLAAHHSVHSAPNIIAALIVIVAGLGVVAATAWAVSTVVARVPATASPRLRRAAIRALAAAMAATTAAGIVWGIAVHAADPSRFASRDGILASPFIPSWIAILVIMAVATALSVRAARRESPSVLATG